MIKKNSGGVRVGSGRKKGSKNGINKSADELKELNRLRMHLVVIERAEKLASRHGSTLEERIAIMSVPVSVTSTQLAYMRRFTPSSDSNVLPQGQFEYSTYNRGES